MKFRKLVKFTAVPALLAASTSSFAAGFDLTTVTANINQAIDDASTVGGLVVAGVTVLMVVGLIITFAKKMTA